MLEAPIVCMCFGGTTGLVSHGVQCHSEVARQYVRLDSQDSVPALMSMQRCCRL